MAIKQIKHSVDYFVIFVNYNVFSLNKKQNVEKDRCHYIKMSDFNKLH